MMTRRGAIGGPRPGDRAGRPRGASARAAGRDAPRTPRRVCERGPAPSARRGLVRRGSQQGLGGTRRLELQRRRLIAHHKHRYAAQGPHQGQGGSAALRAAEARREADKLGTSAYKSPPPSRPHPNFGLRRLPDRSDGLHAHGVPATSIASLAILALLANYPNEEYQTKIGAEMRKMFGVVGHFACARPGLPYGR